jgi:hypothetical protein
MSDENGTDAEKIQHDGEIQHEEIEHSAFGSVFVEPPSRDRLAETGLAPVLFDDPWADPKKVARQVYAIADAMLTERDGTGKNAPVLVLGDTESRRVPVFATKASDWRCTKCLHVEAKLDEPPCMECVAYSNRAGCRAHPMWESS